MRKLTTLTLTAALALGAAAAPTLPAYTFDVTRQAQRPDLTQQPLDPNFHPFQLKPRLTRLGAEAEAQDYFGVFQSCYSGYTFNPAGGDIKTYNVQVTIDGPVATISNLFNLVDGFPTDNSTQQDILGDYDAAAGTISIPTSPNFDNATIAGYIYGTYPGVVVSGEITQDGKLNPADKLVFHVSSDLSTISTDQAFGVAMYSQNGQSSYGQKVTYKQATIKLASEEPDLATFSDFLDFGKSYGGYASTRTFVVFNFGTEPGDFVAECDGDGFSVEPELGQVPGHGTQEFTVTFLPTDPDEYEGLVNVTTDAGELSVQMTGECMADPDYSAVLKSGDVRLSTCPDYPFEVTDKYTGFPVAASTNAQCGATESFMCADFDVPQGKIGVLTWKGESSSNVWYVGISNILKDGELFADYSGKANADIAGTMRLAPGHHTAKWSYQEAYFQYTDPNDRMWVYDVDLQLVDVPQDKDVLLTPELNFPASMANESQPSELSANVSLRNEGSNTLELVSSTSSDHFTVGTPEVNASLLEELTIPVTFRTTQAGDYDENITVTTTAGTYTIPCSAKVREMPDFSQIVEEGEFTFETTPDFPFLVRDGKAYNASSQETDFDPTTSVFTFKCNVPEGKLGTLSYKGRLSCAPQDPVSYTVTDYLQIDASKNNRMNNYGVWQLTGDVDLASDNFPYRENPAHFFETLTPGEASVTFTYVQAGDASFGGDDICEIHGLKLELSDFEPDNAEISADRLEFPTVYEGKTSSATLSIKNTGANNLQIYDVTTDGPFSVYKYPTYDLLFDSSDDITLQFHPTEAGTFEGHPVIKTSAGDFTLNCIGTAQSTEGFLLLEDFEDDAANWKVYDGDGDSESWDLAYNKFGGYPQPYVHGGDECLVSLSYTHSAGDIQPDNWTFSPEFTVPEAGATLTWWIAQYNYNGRAADHYSVYIAEGDRGNGFEADRYTELFNETMEDTDWHQRELDLSAYAGKKVHLAFRHHDCEGQWMLRLDDVIVKDNGAVGIADITPEAAKAQTVYYDLTGRRVANPQHGIYIRRQGNKTQKVQIN